MVQGILVLFLTTAFEVGGLILWVELDARNMSGIGLLILFFGLVLERLAVTGIPKSLSAIVVLVASSFFEYAVWAHWFTLIRKGGLEPFPVFALVLLPGLHFQHAFIASFKENINRTFSQLSLHTGFIFFGLIEAVGGAIWLVLLTNQPDNTVPAHIFLFIIIGIEHIVQGIVLNRINQEGIVAQMGEAN